jgi:hypothetical protein
LACAIEFAADKETCEAFPAKWGMNRILVVIIRYLLAKCRDTFGVLNRDGVNAVLCAILLQLWERILLDNARHVVCWCAWQVTSSCCLLH